GGGCAEGGSGRGDLVVGCDGVNSVVRKAMGLPDAEPAGILSIGGHVDRTGEWENLLPLNRSGAVQYFGPDGWSLFVSLCEREDRTPTVLWALSRRGRADAV